jgi:ubiquinone/menaquinone biosynthesis C-methylase UbiE
MPAVRLSKTLDVDSIVASSCPSFLGVEFDSKPAALRQLLMVKEIVNYYEHKKNVLGLDIGSKYSHLCSMLAHGGIQILRLDIVPRDDSRDFILGDGHSMPFKKEVFDFVVISHVLAHVADLEIFLEQVNYVLKPEGRAFILQSNRYGWWKFWGYYIRRNDRAHHYRTLDVWDMERNLSNASINIEKMYSPYYFYLHSKISERFFKLDRKLEGKIPNIFATQWLIVAVKISKEGIEGSNSRQPTTFVRAGVTAVATVQSLLIKSLELSLRTLRYLKRKLSPAS